MNMTTSTTSNKKRPTVLGALTAVGEVALTVTISGAALLAVGIGVPPAPTAQAHAFQAVAVAQTLIGED
jgi:hypothetical protein